VSQRATRVAECIRLGWSGAPLNTSDRESVIYVRLTKPHGAAHLNGQEVVLMDLNPEAREAPGRVTICLKCGHDYCISVRLRNY
jgi:hypothetical protein